MRPTFSPSKVLPWCGTYLLHSYIFIIYLNQLISWLYHCQHISSKFKVLTEQWEDVDHITVCHGGRSWRLQIKKRSGNVEIHIGWIKLRSDLNLTRNDICFFEKKESIRKYDLFIYRKTL